MLIGQPVDDLSVYLLPAEDLVATIGQTMLDRFAIGLAGGPDGMGDIGGSQDHAVRRWAERRKPSGLHAYRSSPLYVDVTGLKILGDSGTLRRHRPVAGFDDRLRKVAGRGAGNRRGKPCHADEANSQMVHDRFLGRSCSREFYAFERTAGNNKRHGEPHSGRGRGELPAGRSKNLLQ